MHAQLLAILLLNMITGYLPGIVTRSLEADQKISTADVVQRGKKATVYVEVPNIGSGSGFCVHESGLFVTNEHVVRGIKDGEVTLVLNASLESQRTLKARVVRVDKELDLALLRTFSDASFPALRLGSLQGVMELSELVAFGFPLGKALAADRDSFPAMSINSGRVTALRKQGGATYRVQFDGAMTFGNSGGPVLDNHGDLVGIVVSKARRVTGINMAIPVTHLKRFLAAPEIVLRPVTLKREKLSHVTEFRASVVSFFPDVPPPTVRIRLGHSEGSEREFQMELKNGSYMAMAAPALKNSRVKIRAEFKNSSVAGKTDNVVFKVAANPVRLSNVRSIQWGKDSFVVMVDGKTIRGAVTGLDSVGIDIGGQKISVDLRKSSAVAIQPPDKVSSIRATIIASVDGKDIARLEQSIPVLDTATTRPRVGPAVRISPPKLTENRVEKMLPAVFSNVVLGRSGRFLIFHLPKLKKLAIFDISEARVIKYIRLEEEAITFAAGANKLVIGLPDAGVLERWSLENFEREAVVGVTTLKKQISSTTMGHGCYGPVLVNGYFFDLYSLTPMAVKGSDGDGRVPSSAFASADGTVYGSWNTHYSPDSARSYVLDGSRLTKYESGGLRHTIPGPDGKSLYTAKGVVSQTLSRGSEEDANFGYCLPAVRGQYFLSLTTRNDSSGGTITVYLRGLRAPLARLKEVKHGLKFNGWDRESFGPWQRVFLVPDAKLIAVLPYSNDRVVLHRFDPDAALESSPLNYLVVNTLPPTETESGSAFTYEIGAKAKNGPVSFRLDIGPEGMSVNDAGLVEWKVPGNAPLGKHDVVLTIADSQGQEIFHSFSVRVN